MAVSPFHPAGNSLLISATTTAATTTVATGSGGMQSYLISVSAPAVVSLSAASSDIAVTPSVSGFLGTVIPSSEPVILKGPPNAYA